MPHPPGRLTRPSPTRQARTMPRPWRTWVATSSPWWNSCTVVCVSWASSRWPISRHGTLSTGSCQPWRGCRADLGGRPGRQHERPRGQRQQRRRLNGGAHAGRRGTRKWPAWPSPAALRRGVAQALHQLPRGRPSGQREGGDQDQRPVPGADGVGQGGDLGDGGEPRLRCPLLAGTLDRSRGCGAGSPPPRPRRRRCGSWPLPTRGATGWDLGSLHTALTFSLSR
jgi:hypothetical protein